MKKLLALYVVIGILIPALQLGLSSLFQPSCPGIPRHTLWEYYATCNEQASLAGQCSNKGWAIRATTGVVMWLPDVLRKVVFGDMSFKNYLIGGYECTSANFSKGSSQADALAPLAEKWRKEQDFQQDLNKNLGLHTDDWKHKSSQIDRLLSDYIKVTPFTGVTMEVPSSWKYIDDSALRKQMDQKGLSQFKLKVLVPQTENYPAIVTVGDGPTLFENANQVHSVSDKEINELMGRWKKGVLESFEGFKSFEGSNPTYVRSNNMLVFHMTAKAVNTENVPWTMDTTVFITGTRSVSFGISAKSDAPNNILAVLGHIKRSLSFNGEQ